MNVNPNAVNVFKYEQRTIKDTAHPFGSIIREKVLIGHGTFCAWGCDYEEFESGPGNFSVAIVRMPDGTIRTPQPDMIQFINETP